MDKASGLLDRNFLLAYWFPSFVAASIAVLIGAWPRGWGCALELWQQEGMVKGQEGGFSAQILILVGALILITVLAYLLMPLTRPTVRFYEGYWPGWLYRRFGDIPRWGERAVYERMTKDLDQAEVKGDWPRFNELQAELFYGYPKRERLMPTRLGNALRASEDYSKGAYGDGMDTVFWWPRLWPLLPEKAHEEVEEALTPMVALLNFTSLVAIISIGGSLYLGGLGFQKEAVLVFVGGVVLAFISYRAAVSQAQSYGERIRSAVDLYRFELLRSLHQPLPKTLDDEITLWENLMLWLYNGDRGAVAKMEYDHDSGGGSGDGSTLRSDLD